MIPAPLTQDPCVVAPMWRISLDLARRGHRVARRAEASGLGLLVIISGFRTCDQQADLEASGRPAASCDRSTHTWCPASGMDVWLSSAAENRGVRLALLTMAEAEGLRVGGGGPVDAEGLPVDWNHWDLGPRPPR